MSANKTAVCWRTVLEQTHGPAGLCLSRQKVPTFDRTVVGSAEGAARGAYTLLEAAGIGTRVVSVPCMEGFRAQDEAYRRSVLPPAVRARVSVEAGIGLSWHEWLGQVGEAVSLEHFGASAPQDVLYEQFGLTAERVATAAKASLSRLGQTSGSTTGN